MVSCNVVLVDLPMGNLPQLSFLKQLGVSCYCLIRSEYITLEEDCDEVFANIQSSIASTTITIMQNMYILPSFKQCANQHAN